MHRSRIAERVHTSGMAHILPTAVEWEGLAEAELTRALDSAGFSDLPAAIGEPCPDCVRYYIAAVDLWRNRPHFVTTYDGSAPAALQAFADRLIAETTQATPIY